MKKIQGTPKVVISAIHNETGGVLGAKSSRSQLNDMVRFCMNPIASCVFGIDPTFNLGKFFVTVTTFSYSHVINKCTMKSPTFFGPIFVHTEQN